MTDDQLSTAYNRQASELSEHMYSSQREVALWQSRMLPLMQKMIIGLTFFFFVASLGQLIYLHHSIMSAPKIDINKTLGGLAVSEKNTFQERKEATRLKTMTLLEFNTMERRHHEANVLTMSSIWVRYLGFETGMILAFIGAIFILGKLQESISILGAKMQAAEVSIKSSSPGIILVVLGTSLMIITLVMQHSVNVTDAAVYFEPGTSITTTHEELKLAYPADSIK